MAAVTVQVVFDQGVPLRVLQLQVPVGARVRQVIEQSGLLAAAGLEKWPVGIHGRRCDLDEQVREGDRIEIYRPLSIDPKAARRQRARKA